MTKQEFVDHYKELHSAETLQTRDVLMRIASSLSNLHIQKVFMSSDEIDRALNNIKEYVFDYMDVLEETK